MNETYDTGRNRVTQKKLQIKCDISHLHRVDQESIAQPFEVADTRPLPAAPSPAPPSSILATVATSFEQVTAGEELGNNASQATEGDRGSQQQGNCGDEVDLRNLPGAEHRSHRSRTGLCVSMFLRYTIAPPCDRILQQKGKARAAKYYIYMYMEYMLYCTRGAPKFWSLNPQTSTFENEGPVLNGNVWEFIRPIGSSPHHKPTKNRGQGSGRWGWGYSAVLRYYPSFRLTPCICYYLVY